MADAVLHGRQWEDRMLTGPGHLEQRPGAASSWVGAVGPFAGICFQLPRPASLQPVRASPALPPAGAEGPLAFKTQSRA